MRYVVYGAGAIGGVVGGRLHQSGHSVTLIARGEHGQVIRERGLTLEAPGESETLSIEVGASPQDLDWNEPSVVLLSVKSQDTEPALMALSSVVPPETPVVCMQNGVENERRALRWFKSTYAMCVMCPATHLDPGVVQTHSSPITGLLDLGVYPEGEDEIAHTIAGALNESRFDSRVIPTIMRFKYRKLLMNLGNAPEALCGPQGRASELTQRARDEGKRVLQAAGIDVASSQEDAARRGELLTMEPTASRAWGGGSSWQSLARGTNSIETDFLNGEIVLLGRLHGIATPVNELFHRLATEAARSGIAPGTSSPEELLRLAEGAVDFPGDEKGAL
jgi:2-dehydropantoate 2-reductase